MKTTFLSMLILLLSASFALSQDIIVKKDGKQIKCKIVSIDTTQIKVEIDKNTNIVTTYVNTKDVKYFIQKGNAVYLEPKKPNSQTSEMIFADSIENLNRNFIYTNSGQIFFAQIIEYKTPFLGSPKLIVDSKEFRPDDVKIYRNETGFYANTSYTNLSSITKFTKRIRKGNINLYETVVKYYNSNSPNNIYMGGFNNGPGTFVGAGYVGKNIINYYNKGFGDLKKANYSNLSIDLADNPLSMAELNKYKSMGSTQVILGIIGGGLIVTGFATLVNKTKDWDGTDKQPEPNVTGSMVTIGLGAGCFGAIYIVALSKPSKLRNAIDAYNQ